jgi:hypothetical protein
VAVLILKSGAELAVETLRALRGEKIDFSRYELGFMEEYHHFQQRQLADWLLYVIAEKGPITQPALLTHCRETFNLMDVPTLRELGWDKGAGLDKQVVDALETLARQELITAEDALQVTAKGRIELELEGERR